MAYIGGDVLKADVTAKFLRNGLNPLLKQHGCGALIAHHTPKTTNRETTNWKPSDWMYAGGGSADVTNWARAILVLDTTHDPRTFRLIAAKRGRRLSWKNDAGEAEMIRHYCHAKEEGKIAWRQARPEDLARAEQAARAAKASARGTSNATVAEIVALVPPEGSIAKNELIIAAGARHIGKHRARQLVEEALEKGLLEPHDSPRAGGRPVKRISRPKLEVK